MAVRERPEIPYSEYYDFDRLERIAYGKCKLDRTDENEVGVLNLHNHLVWRSYIPGADETADGIVREAAIEIMDEHGLTVEQLPVPLRQLFD